MLEFQLCRWPLKLVSQSKRNLGNKSSSPKRFSLHHVGSFACTVIWSDVMKKECKWCLSNVSLNQLQTWTAETRDFFYSPYLSLGMKVKKKNIQLYLGFICKHLINSTPPLPTPHKPEREGKCWLWKVWALCTGEVLMCGRLLWNSFWGFCGSFPPTPPPVQGNSLRKPWNSL